jgi:hypothetical protein
VKKPTRMLPIGVCCSEWRVIPQCMGSIPNFYSPSIDLIREIANREARSISQICEILLTIGTEAYSKEGSKYLQRYLGPRKEG